MTTAEIISGSIALVSLCVSGYVAYRTLIQKFFGKIWLSQAVVLTHIDATPSLGIACFLENKGAQPGYLEDIRLVVKHIQSGTRYMFYPLLTRDDYSVFESYAAKNWFPFSGFYLLPKDKASKYILFKPSNDEFYAQHGNYHIELEVRWDDSKVWHQMTQNMVIEINLEMQSRWNNPTSPSYQVFSNHILANRMVN
jgi:hypothetical protein